MIIQQPELPQDKPATPDQEWGWTLQHFLQENIWYLLGIALVVFVFFFARYSYRKRYLDNNKD